LDEEEKRMPPIYNTQRVKRPILFLRNAGLASFLAGAVAISAHAQQDQQKQQNQQKQQQLPDGPGKEAMQRVCSGCHGAEIVIGRGLTRDGWTQVVTEMIERGAQGSEDDFGQIVEYLATNFPPKSDTNKKSDGGSKSDSDKGSEPAK
jgi:mono/diheme cytochrome c family protein